MKILIVSDTHRRDENLWQIIQDMGHLDMLIHLGDSEGSEQKIRGWLNEGCSLEIVRGNNDFFSTLDIEKELKIGKYRLFLTHGHYYNVNLGVESLKQEAEARRDNIVMFGHTHKPFYDVQDGIILLNPGSLSFPRQDGRRPSYMVMEIDQQGEAHFDLRFLKASNTDFK